LYTLLRTSSIQEIFYSYPRGYRFTANFSFDKSAAQKIRKELNKALSSTGASTPVGT